MSGAQGGVQQSKGLGLVNSYNGAQGTMEGKLGGCCQEGFLEEGTSKAQGLEVEECPIEVKVQR